MEDGSGDFSPYYHSQYDRLENLNMMYCSNVVRAAVGSAAYLAGPLGPVPET
jgi:hypothetical protein